MSNDQKGGSGGMRTQSEEKAKVVLSDRLFSRYWDAGGVQGSIKGIKWYFFRMLRG